MDGNADLAVGFAVGLAPERGDEPRLAWNGHVPLGVLTCYHAWAAYLTYYADASCATYAMLC